MIKITGENFRKIHIWIDRLQQRMPQLSIFDSYYNHLISLGLKRDRETNYFIFELDKIYETELDALIANLAKPDNLSPAEQQYFDFRLFEINEMINEYKIKEAN